jgi:chromosome partitioning protein
MNIALIAHKGGVGKTTLCVLLHEAIRQAGKTVAVRDFNPVQGSAAKSLKRLGGTLEEPGRKYDFLLIDTPPTLTLSPAAEVAASIADIILVPTSPSPFDVWEADGSARFARSKNSRAVIRIVLNRVKAGTLLTGAVEETLNTSEPVLPERLADRQSYQHAALGGWAALDPKAAQELRQFTDAVTSLCKRKT